jgi:hypothetical protein
MSNPAIVIIGTHGEVVYKQTIDNSDKNDIRAAFHVATWPAHVQVKGIVMPVGGSVHYAAEAAETMVKQKIIQSIKHLSHRVSDYFTPAGNSNVRSLADNLLSVDSQIQASYSDGSKSLVYESKEDLEISPCLDLIKGCSDRTNIVNYTPFEYANDGVYQPVDENTTKVPLIFKNYFINTEESSIGKGTADLSSTTLGKHSSTKANTAYMEKSAESKRTFTEWHITLLRTDGSQIVEEPILEKLLAHPFDETEDHRLRITPGYRSTSNQQIINYLMHRDFDSILIIDVTCCVFRPEILRVKSMTPDNLFSQITTQKGFNPQIDALFNELMSRWFQMYLYSLRNPSQHHPRIATPDIIQKTLIRYRHLLETLAQTGKWSEYIKAIQGLKPIEGGTFFIKKNKSRRNSRRRNSRRRNSVRKNSVRRNSVRRNSS